MTFHLSRILSRLDRETLQHVKAAFSNDSLVISCASFLEDIDESLRFLAEDANDNMDVDGPVVSPAHLARILRCVQSLVTVDLEIDKEGLATQSEDKLSMYMLELVQNGFPS